MIRIIHFRFVPGLMPVNNVRITLLNRHHGTDNQCRREKVEYSILL